MKKMILYYGLLVFALLMLFQLSSMWIFHFGWSTEWMFLLISIVSIGIGIAFAGKRNQKTVEPYKEDKLRSFEELGITLREYEVLECIDQGMTNKEIAARLFISENTVKTHLSSLYSKLDASRRTQAVKNAKDLNIIY